MPTAFAQSNVPSGDDGLCAKFIDGSSLSQQIVDQIASTQKRLVKDEFETTAAFNERAQSALRAFQELLKERFSASFIVVRVPIPPYQMAYDADRQQMSVKSYAIHFPNIGDFYGPDKDTVLAVVSDNTTESASYEASNAMGAKIRVTKELRRLHGLAFDKATLPGNWNELISMSPSDAKLFKENAAYLIVAEPLLPIVLEKTSASRPTFDSPRQTVTRTSAIMGRPRCAALVDLASKRIVHTVLPRVWRPVPPAAQKPPPSRTQAGSRTSEEGVSKRIGRSTSPKPSETTAPMQLRP